MSYLFWQGKKQSWTSSPDNIPGFRNLQSSIILPRNFSSVSSTSIISHVRIFFSITSKIFLNNRKKARKSIFLLMMSKRILQLFFICCDHSGMNILARRYLLCKSQMKPLRHYWVSYLLPLLLKFLIIMDLNQSLLNSTDFQRSLASLNGKHKRAAQ